MKNTPYYKTYIYRVSKKYFSIQLDQIRSPVGNLPWTEGWISLIMSQAVIFINPGSKQ